MRSVKIAFAVGVVAAVCLASAVFVHGDVEFNPTFCFPNVSCSNCLTGWEINAKKCTYFDHTDCFVFQSIETATFKHCATVDQPWNQPCNQTYLEQMVTTCQNASWWYCTCGDRKGNCNIEGCHCLGNPAKTATVEIHGTCT
jgi:hypothetical protein